MTGSTTGAEWYRDPMWGFFGVVVAVIGLFVALYCADKPPFRTVKRDAPSPASEIPRPATGWNAYEPSSLGTPVSWYKSRGVQTAGILLCVMGMGGAIAWVTASVWITLSVKPLSDTNVLLSHVPIGFRATCGSVPDVDRIPVFWNETAVQCHPKATIYVSYYQVGNAVAMNEQLTAEASRLPKNTSCDPAVNPQFQGEESYSLYGTEAEKGSVICYIGRTGNCQMEWTTTALTVYAWATDVSHAGDCADLYNFWQYNAGPF